MLEWSGESRDSGDRYLICPNCQTTNVAGAKFCMGCGSPLASGCPNCGYVNVPEARFCSDCGTGLASAAARPAAATAQTATVAPTAPAPDAAERRLVSVLFADLVG